MIKTGESYILLALLYYMTYKQVYALCRCLEGELEVHALWPLAKICLNLKELPWKPWEPRCILQTFTCTALSLLSLLICAKLHCWSGCRTETSCWWSDRLGCRPSLPSAVSWSSRCCCWQWKPGVVTLPVPPVLLRCWGIAQNHTAGDPGWTLGLRGDVGLAFLRLSLASHCE